MTIRRANPRKQDEIGLGATIHWFLDHGYAVSLPLIDSQPYDLVVDDGASDLLFVLTDDGDILSCHRPISTTPIPSIRKRYAR